MPRETTVALGIDITSVQDYTSPIPLNLSITSFTAPAD